MKNLKRALEARELIVANDNKIIEAEIASLRKLDQAATREYPQWHDHDAGLWQNGCVGYRDSSFDSFWSADP